MSKFPILTETNNFLENYQNNYSAYRINSKEGYFSQDTIVTGTRPAILPMRISTVGKPIANSSNNVESQPSNSKALSSYSPTQVDQRISFTLLINPDSWNHSKTQTVPIAYTRIGWVVQPWGPNQDTISSTGRTAVMMTSPTGLDYLTRDMSFSYLNFLSLLTAYKNNGYKFEDSFDKVSNLTRVISVVYGIEISYDNQTFMGHFNNFTIDEDSASPFVFNYNFEFIISTLAPTNQVRGHYKELPEYNSDLVSGTGADPFSLTLVSDPTLKRTPVIAKPRPIVDKATEKLWGTRTGLTFDRAISMNLTDGSIQGNVVLKSLLMSNNVTWNSNTQKFVNKRGEVWIPGQSNLKDFIK
jgi:hypothetical protein